MSLPLLLGLCLFFIFLVVFFFMMPASSAEVARLEEVTQQVRRPQVGGHVGERPPLINADILAKPFTLFRKFFSSDPDPQVVRRLMLAGYRKPAHADIFLGARLALPALLGVSVALLIQSNVFLFFLVALVVGFFAPDFWLSHAITKRREKIRLSLPDGLDMLAISMEAGLGLDQAIVRIGQEFRASHRELSEEFLQINFEQRAGVQRIAAWKGFADRANIESVRSFVAMLIQTDRFGTPISKSLGNFSDALRLQRRQTAEEKAAKTTIKLVPPLVFFIFPSVGVVTIGPAIIMVSKSLAHLVQ
ncbi:MAG: type II secretion system F family protein [Candidatus Sulfotelmatobacter sp.]